MTWNWDFPEKEKEIEWDYEAIQNFQQRGMFWEIGTKFISLPLEPGDVGLLPLRAISGKFDLANSLGDGAHTSELNDLIYVPLVRLSDWVKPKK